MSHAAFLIENPAEFDVPLIIRDTGNHQRCPTVTNDAEHVVELLADQGHLPPGRRLLYYDSEGRLDEILIKGGRFAGFKVWNGPEPVRSES